jgi:hypothetical protein
MEKDTQYEKESNLCRKDSHSCFLHPPLDTACPCKLPPLVDTLFILKAILKLSSDHVGAKEKTEPRRRHELETSEKKNRRCTVRLFGTNSLKEGAM